MTENTKIIIGRTQKDNQKILKYYNAATDTIVKIKKYAGPITLVPSNAGKEMITLAASLCVDYSKAPNNLPVEVDIATLQNRKTITVLGIPATDIQHFMI